MTFLLFNNWRAFGRWFAHSWAWLLLDTFPCASWSCDERAGLGISGLIFRPTTKNYNSTTCIVWFTWAYFIITDVVKGPMSTGREAVFLILFDRMQNLLCNSGKFTLTACTNAFLFCESIFIGNQSLRFWGLTIIQEVKVVPRDHICQKHWTNCSYCCNYQRDASIRLISYFRNFLFNLNLFIGIINILLHTNVIYLIGRTLTAYIITCVLSRILAQLGILF